jgi:hypothetical protein
MKKLLLAFALLAGSSAAMAQIGVSIDIGQPGFYGRIELGDFRQPPVYYAQPMIIERSPRYAPEPVYLRVPPGHMKKWSKHCGAYNACGRQVYFVKDEWYTNTYAPRYRSSHGGRGGGGGYDRRDDHRDDRRDERRYDDDDRGHGKNKGNGHGNGNGKGHGNGKHKD